MTATAAPLPETDIRTIFTDAPEDITVPSDVSELFKARRASLWTNHKGRIQLLNGLGLVVVVGSFVAMLPFVAVGTLFVMLITWITVLIVQHGRAKKDFFTRYAEARGLKLDTDCHVPTSGVPLLRKGDKRECGQSMHGTIAGQPATLANYTFTEVSTDSEGRRSETDYDYLVLHYRLPKDVAGRFAGVYLSDAGWSLGKLQDKLAHDRAVKLESIDFHKRYSLRVVDGQDDVALYELFHPGFIDRLTMGPEITWEQVAEDLVFYRKKHEDEAADLDAFVAQTIPVLERYKEEHR